VIGRNCVVAPLRKGEDFPSLRIATGETI